MSNLFSAPFETFSAAASLIAKSIETAPKIGRAALAQSRATQDYWSGVLRYISAFMVPSAKALNAFMNTEKQKVLEEPPAQTLMDYMNLFDFNVRLAATSMTGVVRSMNKFCYDKLAECISAWIGLFKDAGSLTSFADRLEETLRVVVYEYPKAIDAIAPEYGFHMDSGGYVKVAETDRFELYQVLPLVKETPRRNKPILIVPPYVLGANILAFLPGEQRSYVHCYADQGVPTYVRLIKDIHTNTAVQVMTGEDDARDTSYFCREIVKRHNQKVTLNGFCQGGYLALASLLSGELDNLVDAFITCVTPVDGTRSKSLIEYMNALPSRFRDPRYSYKKLPNGNMVVDGRILGWVYKLRKLENESPIASFHRDIRLLEPPPGQRARIGKTAAAINHWLIYDQQDLPLGITELSFASYTVPIDKEGTLPVTLFGRKLNLKRLEEKKIPWLICIAETDDLVDREAALAPLDYIDAEVTVFPKGHAALATSWSVPTSLCAPHLRYRLPQPSAFEPDKIYRGPVCFQIDLDSARQDAETGIETGILPAPEPKAALPAPIPAAPLMEEKDKVEEKDTIREGKPATESPAIQAGDGTEKTGAGTKPKARSRRRSSSKSAPPKTKVS